MPIIDVEIVNKAGEDNSLKRGLAQEIADRAGAIFGSAPGQTWVKVRTLPWEQYAEQGGGPPEGVSPVFVSVLKANWPEREEMARESQALAEVIVRICGRPADNVHILYFPPAAGRIAFGGAGALSRPDLGSGPGI
jgi:phenylpyruvate tautomerase PptA (4-oxalocrotonate tautomerase family)